MIRLAVLALALTACEASTPSVPDLGSDGFSASGATADVLLAYTTDSGLVETCADALPSCDDPLPACGPSEVLGAPDGATFSLPPGGRLDVGFRCAAIVELGSAGAGEITLDFSISATLVDGANAIVEVSFDGSEYHSLPTRLSTGSQTFDLATLELDVVRFVRIVDSGNGGIAIDAIESLSSP
jgi:hypothetical protein